MNAPLRAQTRGEVPGQFPLVPRRSCKERYQRSSKQDNPVNHNSRYRVVDELFPCTLEDQSIYRAELPSRELCGAPSLPAHATERTRWSLQGECPRRANPVRSHTCSGGDSRYPRRSLARGYPRCNRHTHNHSAAPRNFVWRRDNFPNALDLLGGYPKRPVPFSLTLASFILQRFY